MTLATRPPASRIRRTLGALVVAFLVPGSTAQAQPLEVTGINAVHRDGQTFVTWKDVAEGERG
ncbi:MAG TPA: hypothetical protein VNU02_02610, partial [Candidatus Dormibacteraeota bacterium]|nr:hypothetical protein [Candidatus Dormibacteraeota bacterium]